MKSARRTNKQGAMEIDFGNLVRPSDEIDFNNPFIRKKIVQNRSIRECKDCGTKFILNCDYDKNDITHDLCDDCILNLPGKINYPEKSIQVEQTEIDAAQNEFLNEGEELVE